MILSNRNNRPVSSYFDSWKANLRIYGSIIGLLRPHWLSSLCTVVCVALTTVFSLVVPWLIGLVIDIAVPQKDLLYLLLAAAAILGASALRGLFAYGQGYFSQSLSHLVAYDLRDKLYAHLQRLSFSFHDDAETGQIMSRMTADIEAVRQFYPLGLMRGLVAVVTFGGVTVLLFEQDWQLALIMLICVPVLLMLSVQVAKRLAPLWFNVQSGIGSLSTIMQESLSGIRVVKSFAREDFEIQKFEQQNLEVRRFNMGAMRLSAWNQPLMVLALNVVTVLIVWVGGVAVIDQRITLGTLVAVTSYVIVLASPVRSFGFMINWFMRGLSGGKRIFNLLDTEPIIKDALGASTLEKVEGYVHYAQVSFAYGNGAKVLDDITIDAKPGQAIALLGSTGSGKSTILHLLPRFYEVTAGSITIDGKDVREVTQSSLRRNIGLVLQDVFLFNATIRDNIAYGTVSATEEQIVEAARIARIHDFICSLPNGYDTWVGERGVTLSGGQKQRVAIARTLLLNPSILVLDDSTSSVDMETEYLIQQALEAVMRGRTTFVVASRLRTIKHADQILVLEHGCIVERGTHESLVKLNGPYARLYDLQLREQEEFEAQMLVSSHLQESQPDDHTGEVAR